MRTRLLVLSLGTVFALSACETIDDIFEAEQVDYKSTVKGDPLSLPPDLSDSRLKPRYVAPDGVASAAAYNKAASESQAKQAEGSVLPQAEDMVIKRTGDTRWLQINRDPNQVYPLLVEFWTDEGFTINRDNPGSGIIETDWAENRAKIPGNLLRRVLGSVIDMVSDSGERERFTTRLERIDGKTEVYISHQRMVETQISSDAQGPDFKWLPAKEDPGLNAVMLSRLMAFLGEDQKAAEDKIRNAQSDQTTSQSQTMSYDQSVEALVSQDSVEDTWRRLGSAVSSAGFSIDESNAESSYYKVRYLDTDDGVERKEANIITRLFGDKGNMKPTPYFIQVDQESGQSLIRIYDENHQADHSDTGRRILQVIAEHY